MEKLKRNKKATWKRCGAKITFSISALLILVTVAHAQAVGTMSLTERSIYRTESTTLNIEVKNTIGNEEIEDAHLQVKGGDLEIQENHSIGSLKPEPSWGKSIDIQTYEETPTGKHTVHAYLYHDTTAMELSPIELTVKKKPLQLDTTLQKPETPRKGNNSLTIKFMNVGNVTITNVEVSANFKKLSHFKSTGKCGKELQEMDPGHSYTLDCQFQALEEASGDYDLGIKTSFTDSEGQEHSFTEYKEIPVESGIQLPSLKVIIAGAAAIAILYMLLRRFI